MSHVNMVFLTGRIVREIELRKVESTGAEFGVLTIAVQDPPNFKTKAPGKTNYPNIKIWGYMLDYIGKHFEVGNEIFIQCKIDTYVQKQEDGSHWTTVGLTGINLVMGVPMSKSNNVNYNKKPKVFDGNIKTLNNGEVDVSDFLDDSFNSGDNSGLPFDL